MAIRIGALGDKRLIEDLLLPSWLSGLVIVTVSILLVAFTIVLTQFGNTVQQGILGLQHIYTQSPVATKASMIGDNFAGSAILNNVLLFLLWGTVGLMVYSVVQGILTGVKNANNVIQELHYINADRPTIIREAITRESIKIVSFVLWWVVFRYAIFKLAPYTIAVAHTLATHPLEVSAWLRSLFAIALCIVSLHVLTILMRLTLLRPRMFGSDIE